MTAVPGIMAMTKGIITPEAAAGMVTTEEEEGFTDPIMAENQVARAMGADISCRALKEVQNIAAKGEGYTGLLTTAAQASMAMRANCFAAY